MISANYLIDVIELELKLATLPNVSTTNQIMAILTLISDWKEMQKKEPPVAPKRTFNISPKLDQELDKLLADTHEMIQKVAQETKTYPIGVEREV